MLTIFMHVALKSSTKNSDVPSSSKLLLDVGIKSTVPGGYTANDLPTPPAAITYGLLSSILSKMHGH